MNPFNTTTTANQHDEQESSSTPRPNQNGGRVSSSTMIINENRAAVRSQPVLGRPPVYEASSGGLLGDEASSIISLNDVLFLSYLSSKQRPAIPTPTALQTNNNTMTMMLSANEQQRKRTIAIIDQTLSILDDTDESLTMLSSTIDHFQMPNQ